MKTLATLLIGTLAFPISTFAASGDDDWRRVVRTRPGTQIRLATVSNGIKDGHLGDADADRVIVLVTGALPSDARKTLLEFATNATGYIGRVPRFTYGKLAVDEQGVHFDGVRIADYAQVFAEIRRDDVREITKPSRPSILGGALGAALGGVAGVATAFHVAFKQCGRSCGDEKLMMFGGLVGMPIAGGMLGAHALRAAKWDVVYRRR